MCVHMTGEKKGRLGKTIKKIRKTNNERENKINDHVLYFMSVMTVKQ